MGQKDGKKWTAAVHLQPTISKSDRLLGAMVAAPGRPRSRSLRPCHVSLRRHMPAPRTQYTHHSAGCWELRYNLRLLSKVMQATASQDVGNRKRKDHPAP
jgi:hypothetical protein